MPEGAKERTEVRSQLETKAREVTADCQKGIEVGFQTPLKMMTAIRCLGLRVQCLHSSLLLLLQVYIGKRLEVRARRIGETYKNFLTFLSCGVFKGVAERGSRTRSPCPENQNFDPWVHCYLLVL
jgi:hypothetical protein